MTGPQRPEAEAVFTRLIASFVGPGPTSVLHNPIVPIVPLVKIGGWTLRGPSLSGLAKENDLHGWHHG
jgi:hypothetical protein